MSLVRPIYFTEEASNIINEHFSKGKWGYKKLSRILSTYIIEYVKNKQTLDNLEIKEKEIQKEIDDAKDRYNSEIFIKEKELRELQINKQKVFNEINIKFILTEEEAKFLNDTSVIIDKDFNKFSSRLRYFNNKFKKGITEEDFYELMKKAKEEFPTAKNYREL